MSIKTVCIYSKIGSEFKTSFGETHVVESVEGDDGVAHYYMDPLSPGGGCLNIEKSSSGLFYYFLSDDKKVDGLCAIFAEDK